jgi:hypothetical protein
LVAAYGFCLLVPSAAFALGAAGHSALCLTEPSEQPTTTHVHADGTVHSHAPAAGQPADQADPADSAKRHGSQICCGLACLSAITPDTRMVLAGSSRFTLISWQVADRALGRTPERLDRPPIFSSSL